MKFSIFLALFFCSMSVWAQAPTLEAMHSGRIVLANEDTLDGSFSVNLTNDLVQYKLANSIKTYSARQIQYFYFQEDELKIIRYFYSLPYSEYGNYKAPHLFELLYLGPVLSLYLRERTVIENVPYYDAFSNRTFYSTRTKIVSDFFFRDNKGLMTQFNQSKKQLLRVMHGQEKNMKQFLKDNSITYSKREDMVRTIDYYNNLIQPLKNETNKPTPTDTSKQR
jgi:hypothetical protein